MLASDIARLATTLATSWRRPRIHLLDEVRLPLRVWPVDLDLFRHLNNGRYLTLMDLGRYQLTLRTGLFDVIRSRGWWPTLGDAAVSFLRELRLLQRFELVSRFAGWEGSSLFIEHRFERRGQVCAQAWLRGVFRHQGRSLPVAQVMAALDFHDPAPPPAEALLAPRSRHRGTDGAARG